VTTAAFEARLRGVVGLQLAVRAEAVLMYAVHVSACGTQRIAVGLCVELVAHVAPAFRTAFVVQTTGAAKASISNPGMEGLAACTTQRRLLIRRGGGERRGRRDGGRGHDDKRASGW